MEHGKARKLEVGDRKSVRNKDAQKFLYELTYILKDMHTLE